MDESITIRVQKAATGTCWTIMEVRSGVYLVQCSDMRVYTVNGPPGIPPGTKVDVDFSKGDPSKGIDGEIIDEGGGSASIEQTNATCDPLTLNVIITIEVDAPGSVSVSATHGAIAGGAVTMSETTETIPVNNETEVSVEGTNVSASWEGPTLNTDGSVNGINPALNVDGSTITAEKGVIGTLKVTHTRSRRVYTLTIPRRANEINRDKAYASTVIAVYGEGNVARLDVTIPDLDDCGSNFAANPDDDDDDDGGCYRLIITVDPCTGEEISRRTETIPCPDAPEEE